MAEHPDKRSRKEALRRWKVEQQASARAALPLPDASPPTRREATPLEVTRHRLLGSMGATFALCFSAGTAYLLWDGFTWWAVLTGVLSCSGLVMLLAFLTTDPISLADLEAEGGRRVDRTAGAKKTTEERGKAEELERSCGHRTVEEGLKAKCPVCAAQVLSGTPSKGQACGHTSIEYGLNAGCVECALLFKKVSGGS